MDEMLAQIVELTDSPTIEVVISSDHQHAMAMTEDHANTLATNLRDKAPAPLEKDGDEISALSTSTRTSKAEKIDDKRVFEVSKQHQLTLEEAREETRKMKEAFELRLAELTKAISTAPALNTLTPDSATDVI